MRGSHLICGACLCVLLISHASADCFSPLSVATSQDPKGWERLLKHAPDPKTTPELQNENVNEIQRLAAGKGDLVNLDYYGLTFKKHSSKSPESVFQELRQHFSEYAAFDLVSPQGFHPYYGKARSNNDADFVKNKDIWEKPEPLGALMSFELLTIGVGVTILGGKPYVVAEQGDVLATCASKLDFIFHTVNTKGGGYHPVNGLRGFGLKDNANGTWTFYSMAADRRSNSPSLVLLEATKGYPIEGVERGADAVSGAFGGNVEVESAEEVVFREGHKFWLKFFGEMRKDLDASGMPVVGDLQVNSKRYPYPVKLNGALVNEVSDFEDAVPGQ